MKQAFLDSLLPIVEFLDGLSPASPSAATELNKEFPVAGDAMMALAQQFQEGVAAGWLCNREGGPGVTYSRVAKQMGRSDFSIDSVRMDSPGPGHSHPNGEFDLCFATEGNPEFDGQPPGWTVYPPGSWHVPTVRGGTMNILYFLPAGAIEFGSRPS